MKNEFIAAIHAKRKVSVTFHSKEDGGTITRVCAPMDYGQGARIKDGLDRFHLWDYFPDDGKKPHPLLLLQTSIQSLVVLTETFDPAEFVTWPVISWHVPRAWGQYS